VRGLFEGTGVVLEFERATTPLHYDSPEHYVAFMESLYGPMISARERLTAEGTWNACRQELVEMMERRDEGDGEGMYVPAEYLLVVGRVPAT
jgi:hypothetical protein